MLIAHRGDTVNFPENTLGAFESAFEKGADGVECDVHLLSQEIIVVHDYLFDKTKDYPTLGNVLEKFGKKGRIEIELKVFTNEIIPQLQALLRQYPNLDYELTTSNLFILLQVRKSIPKASLGAIFLPKEFEGWMTSEFIERKVIETCMTLNLNVAHVPTSVLTKRLVEKLHQSDLKVHSHSYISSEGIDSEVREYQRFCDWEVDQCTFDNIRLLEAVK